MGEPMKQTESESEQATPRHAFVTDPCCHKCGGLLRHPQHLSDDVEDDRRVPFDHAYDHLRNENKRLREALEDTLETMDELDEPMCESVEHPLDCNCIGKKYWALVNAAALEDDK